MKWPRIDRGAVADIDQALQYYAGIGPQLEVEFAAALKTALAQIAKAPRRYSRLETNDTDREVRRAILWRFKYLIIYELVDNSPIVHAVMHASRQPNYWRTSDRNE